MNKVILYIQNFVKYVLKVLKANGWFYLLVKALTSAIPSLTAYLIQGFGYNLDISKNDHWLLLLIAVLLFFTILLVSYALEQEKIKFVFKFKDDPAIRDDLNLRTFYKLGLKSGESSIENAKIKVCYIEGKKFSRKNLGFSLKVHQSDNTNNNINQNETLIFSFLEHINLLQNIHQASVMKLVKWLKELGYWEEMMKNHFSLSKVIQQLMMLMNTKSV